MEVAMGNSSIRVDRRRKGSGPVGRAEAPRRRDTGGGQGAGMPPSGGLPTSSGQGTSFGGLPTRAGQIGGCGTGGILRLVGGYSLLFGGQGMDFGGLPYQGTARAGR